jgi:hypothetical protein
MQKGDRLKVSEDVVAREVGGEMVLMHLDSGTYFGLNPVGTRVWELLAEGERSIAAICNTLAEEFDAEAAAIKADVLALAGELVTHNLVTVIEDQSG